MPLDEPTWRARARAHAERADALTAGHRARARTGEAHPVEDFLFTYYPTRPGRLRVWHPGAGVTLADAAERAGWKHYAPDGCRVDPATIRPATVAFVRGLPRPPPRRGPRTSGCFGLHEWAMVYRADATRHPVPLRLGADGTDAVVENHRLRCTHYDAHRFFTADAAPRNTERPTRERQVELEQPGCLHATMDLYKWATKLGPLVPGELLLDCFALAREVRDPRHARLALRPGRARPRPGPHRDRGREGGVRPRPAGVRHPGRGPAGAPAGRRGAALGCTLPSRRSRR